MALSLPESAVLFSFYTIPDPLTQHSGIVPREAKFRVRRKPPQRSKHVGLASIIVQKHVLLAALRQCNNEDIS
jgi:hypothetical protein